MNVGLHRRIGKHGSITRRHHDGPPTKGMVPASPASQAQRLAVSRFEGVRQDPAAPRQTVHTVARPPEPVEVANTGVHASAIESPLRWTVPQELASELTRRFGSRAPRAVEELVHAGRWPVAYRFLAPCKSGRQAAFAVLTASWVDEALRRGGLGSHEKMADQRAKELARDIAELATVMEPALGKTLKAGHTDVQDLADLRRFMKAAAIALQQVTKGTAWESVVAQLDKLAGASAADIAQLQINVQPSVVVAPQALADAVFEQNHNTWHHTAAQFIQALATRMDGPMATTLASQVECVHSHDELTRFVQQATQAMRTSAHAAEWEWILTGLDDLVTHDAPVPVWHDAVDATVQHGQALLPEQVRARIDTFSRVYHLIYKSDEPLMKRFLFLRQAGNEEHLKDAFKVPSHLWPRRYGVSRQQAHELITGGWPAVVAAKERTALQVRQHLARKDPALDVDFDVLVNQCMEDMRLLKESLRGSCTFTQDTAEFLVDSLSMSGEAHGYWGHANRAGFVEAVQVTDGLGLTMLTALDASEYDRPYYLDGSIQLSDDMDTVQATHESCHAFEAADPYQLAAALGFVQRRIRNSTPISLNTLTNCDGFFDHEKALPGKAYDPYVLKTYRRKGAPLPRTTIDSGRAAEQQRIQAQLRSSDSTEVTSMGVQWLGDKPHRLLWFAAEDPEHLSLRWAACGASCGTCRGPRSRLRKGQAEFQQHPNVFGAARSRLAGVVYQRQHLHGELGEDQRASIVRNTKFIVNHCQPYREAIDRVGGW